MSAKPYDIVQKKSISNARYGIDAIDYTIHFKSPSEDTTKTPYNYLYDAFQSLFEELQQELGDESFARLVFWADELDRPISLPFIPCSKLSAETFFDACERVLQSRNVVTLDNQYVSVNVTKVKQPVASGGIKYRRDFISSEWIKKSRAFVTVSTDPLNLCLGRCILIGISKGNPKTYLKYRNLRKLTGIKNDLIKEAVKLYESCDIKVGTKCGPPEWQALNNYLKQQHGSCLRVFDVTPELIYDGKKENKYSAINILLFEGHCYLINKLNVLYRSKHFCDTCMKKYEHPFEHKSCPLRCTHCGNGACKWRATTTTDEIQDDLYCIECLRSFKTQQCYDAHLSSTCNQLTRCLHCDRTVLCNKLVKHSENDCGMMKCKKCGVKYPKDQSYEHFCFMVPLDFEKYKYDRETAQYKFIYFDVESVFLANGEHEANLICSETTDGEQRYFYGLQVCWTEFLKYVFEMADSRPATTFTLIAHNFGFYDGLLMLQNLHRQGMRPVDIIFRQSRILFMKLRPNLRCVDSLNYMQSSLAKLPNMFGFSNAEKGFFPFFSNTMENMRKTVSYPSLEEFNVDMMSTKERRKFIAKFEETKAKFQAEGKPYNYFDQLLHYCRNDVTVLKTAVEHFCCLYLEATGIHPFVHRFTIPGEVLLFYRCRFLQIGQLPIIGADSMQSRRKSSRIAKFWLMYMSHKLQCQIQTKHTGGEVYYRGKYLDGFSQIDGEKYAFSFHGCFYHAHHCIPALQDGYHPLTNQACYIMRERDAEFDKTLKSDGIHHIVTYECEFKKLMKEDADVMAFAERMKYKEFKHIDIKSSVMGGRVEAFKMKVISNNIERCQVRLYDFISSYAYCMQQSYPEGRPDIIEGHSIEMSAFKLDDYFGLVRCTVLPPRQLLIPVLPIRHNSRLLFPLCLSCVNEQSTTFCEHEKEERMLNGTWTTCELKLAVEEGYSIVEVDEIWHFKSKQDNMFKDYINLFFTLKTCANGWPKGIESEEQKQQYLEMMSRCTGIKIDAEQIRFSQGMRNLSKLLLLSLWGKLMAVKPTASTRYVSSLDQFYRAFHNDSVEVQDLLIVSNGSVMLTTNDKSEAYQAGPTTSLIVGAFTTSYGRIHLYNLIKQVGLERAIYCDTDGLYILCENNFEPTFHPPLTTDLILGGVSNEYRDKVHKDAVIDKFVCLGCKNYGLHYYVPGNADIDDNVYHVRGIQFNYHAEQAITLETMEKLLADSEAEMHIVNPNKIHRQGKGKGLINKTEKRLYRFKYDKRMLDWNDTNLQTYPFGYCCK